MPNSSIFNFNKSIKCILRCTQARRCLSAPSKDVSVMVINCFKGRVIHINLYGKKAEETAVYKEERALKLAGGYSFSTATSITHFDFSIFSPRAIFNPTAVIGRPRALNFLA